MVRYRQASCGKLNDEKIIYVLFSTARSSLTTLVDFFPNEPLINVPGVEDTTGFGSVHLCGPMRPYVTSIQTNLELLSTK